MWVKKLKLQIFTARTDVKEFFQRNCPELPDCTMEILSEQSVVTPESCAAADILILDLPLAEIPADIRSYCEPETVQLVLMDPSGEEAEHVSAALAVQLDAIWRPPYSDKRLQFDLRQLMKRGCEQQALWEQRHLLDTLLDSVPDLIWFKDTKGAHLKVNAAFCRMVGKTKEDCVGRGHYYIWNIAEDEYAKGEFVCLESEEEVMEKGETCIFDEKIKGPNDHMLQFHTYKSPVFAKDGSLLGTMGVAHDVTDWKNKSMELNVMLNTLRAPAMVVGATGLIFTVNRILCEFFHQKKTDVLGKPYALWKNDTLHIQGRLLPGELKTFSVKRPEGMTMLEAEEEPIFDVFEQKLGYFCVFRDITEKEKHRQLQENYKRQLETDIKVKTRTIHDIQKRIYISFADLLTSRDHATGDHIRNTSLFVDVLLEELKREDRLPEMRDEAFCEAVSRSVPLHDIGKLGMPDAVLYKEGKYTPEEYNIMRQHAVKGKQIIDKTIAHIETFKFYRTAADMAATHHERWDGNGYPRGLKGKEIPLAGRIMAVADVFDALISKRSYNATMSVDQAYVVIKASAGTQFDPEIAAAFIIARPKIEKVIKEKIYRMS